MAEGTVTLCMQDGCRLLKEHRGSHQVRPTSVWSFMGAKDKDKLTKAGFATPRGGAKGAYQNHVLRSNRVIVPYERLADVVTGNFQDGIVVRLFFDQYFSAAGIVRPEFETNGIVVGDNAFVLYRTHNLWEQFPPLPAWRVRGLEKDGVEVDERDRDVVDVGHYVKRIPPLGDDRAADEDGKPQGIFAPEYADAESNYLSKCVLAWLTVQCHDSPYTTKQAMHLRAILSTSGVVDEGEWERRGVTRAGFTCCPLCLRFLRHSELHEMVTFVDQDGLINAEVQLAGATRSTVVNLFHMRPLKYGAVEHTPRNVAWGHAICNTRLGQRMCHSLAELMEDGLKVGVITSGGQIETFGWITRGYEMIRSARGAVWIRLHRDMSEEEWADRPSRPDPADQATVDRAVE